METEPLPLLPSPLPFSVCLWGSKPGDNDDCWTGRDYATALEAFAAYQDPGSMSDYIARLVSDDSAELWVMVDGPDLHEERRLHKGRAKGAADRAWRQEIAMEAGMAGGCDAYNEAMGWD